MARIKDAWMGFETGSAQEFNGANNGLAAASATTARTGTYSLALHGGPIVGASGYATHIFPANVSEFYFRLAWHINAAGIAGYPYLQFLDDQGDPQLTLEFNGPTQSFKLYRGAASYFSGTLIASGTIVTRANVWYLLEGHVVIHDSTGEFELKINAVTDIAVTGADTKATSQTGARGFKLFGPSGVTNGELYVDDIAFNDTTGSFENSYPGLGGVFFLKANGDGSQSDFTPSTGVNHYACVDDVPGNTTDWVQGLTSGDQELFDIEDTPQYVTTINVVQPCYQAAVAVSGSNELRDIVDDGATIYSGDDTNTIISIAPAYVLYRGKQYYEQPDGVSGAFDATALDALAVGIEIP